MPVNTFSETQKFRNPVIFILLLGILGLSVWGIVQQIFMGQPFGTKPAPDVVLILFSMIPVLFLLLFIFMKQITNIDNQGIEVIISPLGRRRISWKNIEKAYIRDYKPLMEYGGWGIRYGFGNKGMAYSLGGGNKGLQLELKNGKKILVGTKKALELDDFLNQINKP
jgi:hypothetical protein